jgi:hypothetical protein
MEVSDITPVAVIALKTNSEHIITPQAVPDFMTSQYYRLNILLFFIWCCVLSFWQIYSKNFQRVYMLAVLCLLIRLSAHMQELMDC